MSTRRRVLFVTTGLELGGAEALLLSFARYCRAVAWDPTVVTLLANGHYQQRLAELGIPVIELRLNKYGANIRALRGLAKIIRQIRPDILQSWMYHANAFTTWTLLITNVFPESRLYWGIFNSALQLKSYPMMTRTAFHLQARWSMRPAGIIYNGERACREHTEAGFIAQRNLIFSNGIDLDRFRPDPASRRRLREELGIGEEVPVAVIAARNDPMKDWPTALAAVSRVPGLVTLACGLGTQHLPPQDRLIRLGPRTDMSSIYAASDIFFLPSAFGEGTSVAMCEAAASGLPILTTDVGDNAAFARRAGDVVAVGDIAAMTQSLARLAGDAAGRHRFGRMARQMAVEHFNEDAVFCPIVEAYQAGL